MRNRPLLEICVETLAAALAAERGGADRIELCENLSVGGETPNVELMRAARAQIHIPIFAMIRPRAGDFFYTGAEFEQMVRDLELARNCGMDGLVFGLLNADRVVDIERTRALVELARSLPVTFHRAFDETLNLRGALESVMASGAARILTCGGKGNAEKGSAAIAELVKAAGSRIEIVAGGGINAANLEEVLQRSRAREIHSGLSSALPYPRADHSTFEAEIRRMTEVLKKPSGESSPAREQNQAMS
jgi:copper homeostasis protein